VKLSQKELTTEQNEQKVKGKEKMKLYKDDVAVSNMREGVKVAKERKTKSKVSK